MKNVFVEPAPRRAPPRRSCRRLRRRERRNSVLHTSKTQEDVIAWAKKQGYTPLVARVRHLNYKKKRDYRRSA
jgi:hypothetical protein